MNLLLFRIPLIGVVLDVEQREAKMVANHDFSHVDTLGLKDLMHQRVGLQRAGNYFDLLSQFFSAKLSKVEFERRCLEIIGGDNIPLHNQLIRSIIQNACQAKVPPLKARKCDGLGVKVANGYQRNCLQSLYGSSFPQSPRKCRSPVNRDRKLRDRPSPLGPLGKSPSITCEETVSKVQEESAAEMHSLCSRPPMNEDGEEVEQVAGIPSSQLQPWSCVTAPFGISYHTGGTRKDLHYGVPCHGFTENCQSSGEFPDTGCLRSRMLKRLASDGVGVSVESADVLNNGLNVFLKRLIEPCVGITRSRRRNPRIPGKQLNSPMISGLNGMPVFPENNAQFAMQSFSASVLDFRVGIESNPSILGEDWSTQLEKISHSSNYSIWEQ